MPHNTRMFAKQLNKGLDDLGAPNNPRERSIILSKMLRIPKQQAWGLLEGQLFPDDHLLEQIATELEIDREELLRNKE